MSEQIPPAVKMAAPLERRIREIVREEIAAMEAEKRRPLTDDEDQPQGGILTRPGDWD